MRIANLIFALVLIAVGWGAYADYSLSIARFFSEDSNLNLQGAGTWGDSFGGFNALVSALGAAVVIWTLRLQQQSIKSQAADSHRQNFDTSFFELLRLLRELRGELRFKYSKDYKDAREASSKVKVDMAIVHTGLDAVIHALYEIAYWHRGDEEAEAVSDERMKFLYFRVVYRSHESTFSPYFRMIYTILDRIRRDTVLSSDDKAIYGNLLRSQLTARELYILAYNAMHPVSKDLVKLLAEFHMFKYMPSTRARRRIQGNFASSTFRSRT